jgi:hypothetical protein
LLLLAPLYALIRAYLLFLRHFCEWTPSKILLSLRPLRGITRIVISLKCRDCMFTMPILLHQVHERPDEVQGEWENDGGVFL